MLHKRKLLHSSVNIKASAHLYQLPFYYAASLKTYIFLYAPVTLDVSGWMQCLISFVLASPSYEERDGSENSKGKYNVSSGIRTQPGTAFEANQAPQTARTPDLEAGETQSLKSQLGETRTWTQVSFLYKPRALKQLHRRFPRCACV